MQKTIVTTFLLGLINTQVHAQMNTVNEIASQYEEALFDRSPESALFFGYSKATQNRFSDHSYEAQKNWEVKEDQFLNELSRIDPKSIQTNSEFVTYQLLKETLEANRAYRVCKEPLWSVSHQFGWHIILSSIAQKQPVGNPKARREALERWKTVAKVADDEINNLRLGLANGYSAPKPVVTRVLIQLEDMVQTDVSKSPFYTIAQRDESIEFKHQIEQIIKNEINPALERYIQFLKNEYYPKARTSIHITAFPDGDACYAAMLRKNTTLNISPIAIHQLGLQHMEVLKAEVAKIGQTEYGITDMAAVFAAAKADPRSRFQSEDEILKYNYDALNRVKSIVHDWFSEMPKADAVIIPYPPYRAKTGTTGEYHPPRDDGTEPGIFYINTYQPEKKSRVDQEATLFHELIPGHHFQVALAQEDKSHHQLDQFLWNSGFGEGWALYVERLADEMNLYKDNISRLGMLSNEAMRAARLVVDPGMHTLNWSREQAMQYLRDHTALDEINIESEVDRYIIMPGQATSYMLGKFQIESLRTQSKEKLGDKFDIREFHKQVLKNGCVTLPMLQAQIEAWWALN